MVLIDTTTLLLLIDPEARPPYDPKTGKRLERCRDRIEFLLERLTKAAVKVGVPTPVLAEVLVGAGKARNEYLAEIQATAALVVLPFDVKSAVELSFLLDAGGQSARKRMKREETLAKVKFDRQIVAIAKANLISEIYSDDGHLTDVAVANGLIAHHTWDLPLPPQKSQVEMDLPLPEKPIDEDEESGNG